MGIPVVSSGADSSNDMGKAREEAASQGQRTQGFPPGLDQIEPRCVGGLKQEVNSFMSQGPQANGQRAMNGEVV